MMSTTCWPAWGSEDRSTALQRRRREAPGEQARRQRQRGQRSRQRRHQPARMGLPQSLDAHAAHRQAHQQHHEGVGARRRQPLSAAVSTAAVTDVRPVVKLAAPHQSNVWASGSRDGRIACWPSKPASADVAITRAKMARQSNAADNRPATTGPSKRRCRPRRGCAVFLRACLLDGKKALSWLAGHGKDD